MKVFAKIVNALSWLCGSGSAKKAPIGCDAPKCVEQIPKTRARILPPEPRLKVSLLPRETVLKTTCPESRTLPLPTVPPTNSAPSEDKPGEPDSRYRISLVRTEFSRHSVDVLRRGPDPVILLEVKGRDEETRYTVRVDEPRSKRAPAVTIDVLRRRPILRINADVTYSAESRPCIIAHLKGDGRDRCLELELNSGEAKSSSTVQLADWHPKPRIVLTANEVESQPAVTLNLQNEGPKPACTPDVRIRDARPAVTLDVTCCIPNMGFVLVLPESGLKTGIDLEVKFLDVSLPVSITPHPLPKETETGACVKVHLHDLVENSTSLIRDVVVSPLP